MGRRRAALLLAAATALLLSAICIAEAGEPPTPPPASTTHYRIDGGASTAGFTLGATLHTVVGGGGKVSGQLTLDADGPARWKLGGEVQVDAGSLDTGNIKRDFKMHNDTLEVTRFPLLRFIPADAAGTLPASLRNEAGPFALQVDGKLEIRGVARDLSAQVKVSFRGTRLVVDGAFPIPFLDWGVPDPSVFVLRVDKVIEATFHLEAIPTAE